MGQRHIPLCHRIAEPERSHAIGKREDLVEAMKVEQRDQPVVVGIRETWLDRNGFFEPRQRLCVATKPPERKTQIVADLGITGIEMVRAPAVGRRLLVSLEAIQNPCARPQRRSMVREQAVAEIKAGKSVLVAPKLVEQNPALVERVVMA